MMNQSTKINLIGCDTILNSPSYVLLSSSCNDTPTQVLLHSLITGPHMLIIACFGDISDQEKKFKLIYQPKVVGPAACMHFTELSVY